jgi:hypothetical protein
MVRGILSRNLGVIVGKLGYLILLGMLVNYLRS